MSGTNLFAGTEHGGVYLSTNSGSIWTAVDSGLTNTYVFALASSGTNLFAGTDGGGVFLSTNNGANWTAVNSGLTNSDIRTFTAIGTNVFAGTSGGGVFLSTNNGTNWIAVNSGLTNTIVFALTVSGTNLFAGTYGGGIWRRSLSDMITSVEQTVTQLPMRFVLYQNYPNPFNPGTTISFNLLSKSYVSLKVFDVLGREVATIVSEEMPTGSYSRKWNASNMSSGIYFYHLQAGSFTETKKLVLLR